MVLVENVVVADNFCFCVNPLSAIEHLKIRTAGKWPPHAIETKCLMVDDYVLLYPDFKNFILLNTLGDGSLWFLRSVLIVNYSGNHIVDTEAVTRWRNVLCSTG